MTGRTPSCLPCLLFPLISFLFLALSVLCVSCSRPAGSADGTVTFISWNVQTLFDDRNDGAEFPEYAGDGWNAQLHRIRLDRIGRVLLSAAASPPDIAAFQEVESTRSLRELAAGPLRGREYRWAVVPQQAPGVLGPAILSRLPLRAARAHAFSDAPGRVSRPILEVRVETEGRTLVLFNNHWKSRREGALQTEPRRIADARILARRIRAVSRIEADAEILAVGDLNESSREYRKQDMRYPTALMPAGGAVSDAAAGGLRVSARREAAVVGENGVTLYEPLQDPGGPGAEDTPPGTYRYQGDWEDLDHVLVGPGLLDACGLVFASCRVLHDEALLDDRGSPFRWDIRTGRGVSDHLPICGSILIR